MTGRCQIVAYVEGGIRPTLNFGEQQCGVICGASVQGAH